MKRTLLASVVLILLALPLYAGGKEKCATIQGDTIYASNGDLIQPGFDIWGYNYQATFFYGDYCDAYRGAEWCQPYVGTVLQMNWNDAWLSPDDCDDDGLLDRHHGFPSYIGSGAWLTNHMMGVNPDGSIWTYFVKIVAAPADAFICGSSWCESDGTEIGPVIWGQFAIIQEVENDPSQGKHGVQFHSPVGPGLGKF